MNTARTVSLSDQKRAVVDPTAGTSRTRRFVIGVGVVVRCYGDGEDRPTYLGAALDGSEFPTRGPATGKTRARHAPEPDTR